MGVFCPVFGLKLTILTLFLGCFLVPGIRLNIQESWMAEMLNVFYSVPFETTRIPRSTGESVRFRPFSRQIPENGHYSAIFRVFPLNNTL